MLFLLSIPNHLVLLFVGDVPPKLRYLFRLRRFPVYVLYGVAGQFDFAISVLVVIKKDAFLG